MKLYVTVEPCLYSHGGIELRVEVYHEGKWIRNVQVMRQNEFDSLWEIMFDHCKDVIKYEIQENKKKETARSSVS